MISVVAIGWSMTNDASNDGISPSWLGTGRKPRASIQPTSAAPNSVSNSVSGTNVATSVDQLALGMWRLTSASLTTSPPRAGMIALSPEPAR